ncbi:MAG: YHS domain protein [candidate division KSB1 bacterium]|nr:YHS domain protein [candidate division KSB1 bacterium]MDZ7364479.1 YHS domain protein [candidate division KSB1 bacterium]MDZ7402851.1 YHS domain protein [candidate division KSB1 bacterium]
MMTKLLCYAGILVLLICSTTSGLGADNLKLKGYDPVAYCVVGKPVKGEAKFGYTWRNATFRFSSTGNLELFKKSPEKYAPQYGGYCAYAVSQNYTAPVDPEAFDIVNGKLYLNYSKAVQKKWRENRDNYIAAADKNWPALKVREEKKVK